MLAGTTRRITGPRSDREEELEEEQHSSERKGEERRVQRRDSILCTGQQQGRAGYQTSAGRKGRKACTAIGQGRSVPQSRCSLCTGLGRVFDFSQERWLKDRRSQGQRHKGIASREAETITMGREGGCLCEDAACAPGRFARLP